MGWLLGLGAKWLWVEDDSFINFLNRQNGLTKQRSNWKKEAIFQGELRRGESFTAFSFE